MKSARRFEMPPLEEDAYLRCEWVVVPTKLGGWGQDLRVEGASGSPFVVGFTGALPTLKAHLRATTPVTEGEPNTLTVGFTRSAVLSWTINGEEQLESMVPAWRGVCGDDFTLSLTDFTDTKSASRWDAVRLANIRDGIEDYEALCVLRDLTAKARAAGADAELVAEAEAALAVDAEVSVSWTEYTQEPRRLLAERKRVDEMVERLRE